MCISNLEFRRVNPTTQVALWSVCLDNCTSLVNITWQIYYGMINSSSNTSSWTPFNQMQLYENIWFFGTEALSFLVHVNDHVSGTMTSNFTALNQLFLNNPLVVYWRFEVTYFLDSDSSRAALDFIINQPPRNGSCSISPQNGTTQTVFTVVCPNWFDEDGIGDYSVYGKAPIFTSLFSQRRCSVLRPREYEISFLQVIWLMGPVRWWSLLVLPPPSTFDYLLEIRTHPSFS